MDASVDATVGSDAYARCTPLGTEASPSRANISLPADFTATHVISGFVEDCVRPQFAVGLAQGGCDQLPNSQQLMLYLDVESYRSGVLTNGANGLFAGGEPTGIEIRLRRGDGLFPGGTWGSCNGALGQVTLTDFNPDKKGPFAAIVELELDGCGELAGPSLTVRGTLVGNVIQPLTELCP